MIKSFRKSIMLIISILCCSCVLHPRIHMDAYDSFRQLYPQVEWNTQVVMENSIITDQNTGLNKPSEYHWGDNLYIGVTPASASEIWFPYYFGVKTYVYENEQWKEIESELININFPRGDFIFTNKLDSRKYRLILIQPSIQDWNKAEDVRVVIIGKLVQNQKITDEQVGAYIDLTMHPK